VAWHLWSRREQYRASWPNPFENQYVYVEEPAHRPFDWYRRLLDVQITLMARHVVMWSIILLMLAVIAICLAVVSLVRLIT